MREFKEPFQVLIVDDEEMYTDILPSYLNELFPSKFVIRTTNSPEEAKSLLTTERFDIFITDLLMPKIGGDSLLGFCRESSKGTQVIIVSGAESLNLAVNCFVQGASSFIRKPFGKQEVSDSITIVLKQIEHWNLLINGIVTKRNR